MPNLPYLGEIVPIPETFSNCTTLTPQALCELIQKAPQNSFLLGAVLDFIDRMNLTQESYTLASFELWLNSHSGLSDEENYNIRAKIAGKTIPRSDYQHLFPVGMNQVYPGPHMVVAHLSPDVDAMVASFWGWLDAFAARVGTGIHHWCLPDGPPDAPFTAMFENMIGKNVFTYACRTNPSLAFTAADNEDIVDGKKSLGTVSFRDFCNFEEVKMAPYLEVISVIDHHKNSLKTSSVPFALIADVQSCNVLLAEQAFLINDRYSTGGMTVEQIEEQIKSLSSPKTPKDNRLLQRLLQRRFNAQAHSSFTIHAKREYCEYLSFLQAIIDDTDLLSKVSTRDVECIVQLLNRLKSLAVGQEMEIIALDDIPRDKHFAKQAAKRILQQADMYSIYKQIYDKREKSFEDNLALCVKSHPSNLFLDTKEQNGCARVGQSKLFMSNFPCFLEHAQAIRKVWLDKSKEVFRKQPEIDLYIHMMSTITSAQEVFNDKIGPYAHGDELWFWMPSTQMGQTHLNHFLSGFQHGVGKELTGLSIEFYGQPSKEFVQLFKQHFHGVKQHFVEDGLKGENVAVLRFEAGKLNSRKAMISPFLPKL